jgi:cellulose synthase/poly-beta-1,6-N-acetylglucosamine synthase-like glycosyltransferase
MTLVQTILAAALVLCALAVFYSYAGYAVVVWLAAKRFGREDSPEALSDEELPTISLLISAYNEEDCIEKRVQNALAFDYPKDKVQIVVASDGSSDATAEIVRRYTDHGVRLLDYKQRRGKATVLNTSFSQLTGDIVLMSDANTFTDSDAPRKLVRWFTDPTIGVVCGRLILNDPASGKNSDGLYWKYETFLKKCESKLGALLGSNGAIYALRRRLFVSIPNDTIVDDFVIPLLAKLRSDCRIVYDVSAVAREETAPDIKSEFRRRTRIGAGGFQSIGMLWKLLDVRHGWVALAFFSHKVLRWTCPFFMLGMIGFNLALLNLPIFQWVFAAQAAFYLAALIGALVPGKSIANRLLRLTTMFTSMNAALMLGFLQWLFGTRGGTWHRTERSVPIEQQQTEVEGA